MNHKIWQNNGIEALPQFLASLAIGLLIGLEREHRPPSKAGLRTFALVALLGTLTAMLSSKIDSPWLLITGFCIVGVMIVTAYLRKPRRRKPSRRHHSCRSAAMLFARRTNLV